MGYKFFVPLSCRKRLQVALFKKGINVLETKKQFSTYLPFCLFLTEKIFFLSNVFRFGNRNRKFHLCIFPWNCYYEQKQHAIKSLVICATQLADGSLLKKLKYFEVMINIFKFQLV